MTFQTTENEIYFDPMQVVYDLLNSKVLDINEKRRELPRETEKRWIFPTLPEEDDENYPRVSIIPGRLRFEEFGADQIIGVVKDQNGNTISEVYGDIIIMPITITVFTKKKTAHQVVFADGSKRTLQNSAQSAFLQGRIQKILKSNRKNFIESDMDVTIGELEQGYEDNEFLFAADIDCEITMKNIWTSEVREGHTIQIINVNTALN